MRIYYERYPDDATEEEKQQKDICTIYRGDIYCSGPKSSVRDDVIEHEKIHLKQAGNNYDEWFKKCNEDEEFYIEQEVEAYKAQIEYIRKTIGEEKAKRAIVSFAEFLSGPLYGNIISFKEALKRLQI